MDNVVAVVCRATRKFGSVGINDSVLKSIQFFFVRLFAVRFVHFDMYNVHFVCVCMSLGMFESFVREQSPIKLALM